MRLPTLFLLTTFVSSACVTDSDQLAEESQPINGDTSAPASQFQLDRAIKIPGCTATRISARFAVTAAHCNSSVNSTVRFYEGGPGVGSGTARIEEVILRPGVSGPACNNDEDNCWDSSGRFADIALLRLSAADENDLEGPHATLAWTYPGDGATGKKVGAGGHNGNANPNANLRQATDQLSGSDQDGSFDTVDDHTDGGDSGGPFYVSNRVVGVLWGSWWVPFDHFNVYTSVPRHLSWILTQIGYSWRGQPSQTNRIYGGNLIEAVIGTELVCQYACEKTTSCEAYSYNPSGSMCGLYSNVTSSSTLSGWRGALKHGARSGNSNDVVGYVRSDGLSAVVHTATNGRIHELLLDGAWSPGDIHSTAPAVASKLTAYRRSDGINAVVYRSTSNRIIEIALTNGTWKWFDLTTVTSAETAAGSPVAYVRTDGVSAIVYRGAASGHIIELRLGSRGWLASDLTAASGASLVASSDPSATVRSDGQNSIVFRSGSHIWELYQANGQNWVWGVPSQLAAGAPPAASRPFGYAHRNGTNAIVYRSTTNQVIELYLVGGQWHWGQIGSGATGDPTAYVRTDGVEVALFRNSAGHIIELTNTPWQAWNLTSITGASASTTNPAVYHRRDGYNAVLFETSANHVGELYWKPGAPQWNDGDLTAVSGETP